MQQETFKKLNTCMAWLVFAIAAIVYGLTVEPTACLWDCPEFIACGYKLEIGHPPGAPVFMLAANLFSVSCGADGQSPVGTVECGVHILPISHGDSPRQAIDFLYRRRNNEYSAGHHY